MRRNGWLASVGITGWFASEYAPKAEGEPDEGGGGTNLRGLWMGM